MYFNAYFRVFIPIFILYFQSLLIQGFQKTLNKIDGWTVEHKFVGYLDWLDVTDLVSGRGEGGCVRGHLYAENVTS